MNAKHYDSDLSEAEFAILEPLLPARKARGRPRSVVLHEILNAIFYILRGGVPWRMLPDGFPPREAGRPLLPPVAPERPVGDDQRRPARARA